MENTFGIPIIPGNEEKRLAELYKYKVLVHRSEGSFKDVATMAAHVFQVPIALVTLVDRDEVLVKANVGMEGTHSVSRGISLCSLAILNKDGVVFEDAAKEPCLLSNPLVAGDFGLRFYAGAPLVSPDGYSIGAVCIVDKEPRTFTVSDQQILQNFATLVMEELEAMLQVENILAE